METAGRGSCGFTFDSFGSRFVADFGRSGFVANGKGVQGVSGAQKTDARFFRGCRSKLCSKSLQPN